MKILINILLVFIAFPVQAQIFESQSPRGDLHFTDSAHKIPSENKLLNVTSAMPDKLKTSPKNTPSNNYYVPRAIVSQVTPFVNPTIKSYCFRIAGGGYSLTKTCVHRELAGQGFFTSNFVPKKIRKYCRTLVGQSWARMEACARKELHSKNFLGQIQPNL